MASATSSAVAIWPECALKTTGHPAAKAATVSPPAVENASGNYSRQIRQLVLPQLYIDANRHAAKAYVLAMPHQYGHHKIAAA